MNQQHATSSTGFSYFIHGLSLMTKPGLRRFVLLPLLINITLFSSAFFYSIDWIYLGVEQVMSWVPAFLSWLSIILYPLAFILLILLFFMSFNVVGNMIAAPFNGMLSEHVERYLVGKSHTASNSNFVSEIPRTVSREWHKLRYYIPRAIGFFLLSLILPGVGHLVWVAFTAWMLALQYCDFPFDNHKITFTDMKLTLRSRKGLTLSFGIAAMLFTMIPIVNWLVMPAAVCGATKLWVENYRQDFV